MNDDDVRFPFFPLELADRLQKRLTLDISYRSADLDDGNDILIGVVGAEKARFDFICDVRDHLNGTTAVIAVPLLVEDGPVDFSRRHVRVEVQTLVDEPLVMSEVEVGLCSVVRHKDFAVLDRVHGPGVDVDIRIEFLHGHPEASRFQKSSEGSCGDAFAEAGDNAAGNENILHVVPPRYFRNASAFLPRRARRVSAFHCARLRSAGGFYSSSRDCTHNEGKFHFARVSHV